MRVVPTEYVPEGAILADTLFTIDGRVLVREGAKLNGNLVEKINMNSIYMLYIHDEHSDAEVDKLIDPVLRQKCMQIVKEIFLAAGNRNALGELKPQSIFDFIPELNEIADDIIYELSTVQEKMLEYIDIKNVENYLYLSSVNTAILSLLIGMEVGVPRDQHRELFLSGIFHDIGLAMLPRELIMKQEELTMEEKREILMHPKVGHEYLKDHAFLSAYVKATCLQHHEHINGSGYPNRMKGDQIHKMAQIVGIADIYDAMTSDRPYRRAVTPVEAVEFLMGTAGTRYDQQYVMKFVEKINPYPLGSLVKLNNGNIAVVDAVNKGMPLRPKIRVIDGQPGSWSYTPVDLAGERRLIIDGIHYDQPHKK